MQFYYLVLKAVFLVVMPNPMLSRTVVNSVEACKSHRLSAIIHFFVVVAFALLMALRSGFVVNES